MNGCPLRRVNQIYTIATKTRLDIDEVKVGNHLNDKYFKRQKLKKPKHTEGEIFDTKKEVIPKWLNYIVAGFPTRTGKPGKMGRHFPVREKSGNFGTDWKSREESYKILENSGNFRQILFVIFSNILMNYVLFPNMDVVFS